MNKLNIKGKSVLTAGFLSIAMLSSVALAEKVDFTASTHINRGTCMLNVTGGTPGLIFDFGNVTPIQAFNGTQSKEAEFKLENCVAVNNLRVSMSSTSTVDIASGNYKGKWVAPASGGATGVAYKTEIKNGRTANYFNIEANNIVPSGTETYVTDWYLVIKATVIPSVNSTAEMTAGSLNSSAVLNITYL